MLAKYALKIQKAIDAAISHLDQILIDQKAGESKGLRNALWHASEEVEYASAILSLACGLSDFDPEFKDPSLQRANIERSVLAARTLLVDALRLLEDNPTSCYEKLRYAVQILRKIQVKSS